MNLIKMRAIGDCGPACLATITGAECARDFAAAEWARESGAA